MEFGEFGEADVVDVIREGFDSLRKLDLSFAEALRTALFEKFSEHCAKPPADPSAISDERVNVTRLSNEEAEQSEESADSAEDDSGEDTPEVGYKRGSYTLVARGDDFPDEWDGWLDELVESYRNLFEEAERKELDLEALGLVEDRHGLMGFSEQLGVDFEQHFWVSECISRHYQLGWIKTSEIPKARGRGLKMLNELSSRLSLL